MVVPCIRWRTQTYKTAFVCKGKEKEKGIKAIKMPFVEGQKNTTPGFDQHQPNHKVGSTNILQQRWAQGWLQVGGKGKVKQG